MSLDIAKEREFLERKKKRTVNFSKKFPNSYTTTFHVPRGVNLLKKVQVPKKKKKDTNFLKISKS